jgi:hypothetical protein
MRCLGFAAALVSAALTATGITVAAPAAAGCEQQAIALYCDGPVQADGTWDRCVAFTLDTVFGKFGQVTGNETPTNGCYNVDPNAYSQYPLGQPRYRIYP